MQGRSLVNKNADVKPVIYTLEPVILKYTTNRFVEETVQQIIQVARTKILQGDELFISHSFVTTSTEDDDLTQQQIRRIVKSIQDKLLAKFQDQKRLEDELIRVLSLLEEKGFLHGYGRQNILSLLSS